MNLEQLGGEKRKMNVKEIPQCIFRKISEEFGKGEEKNVTYKETAFSVRELTTSGFIGYSESSNATICVFFSQIPVEKDDFFLNAIVEIETTGHNLGVWAFGSGCQIKENIYVKLSDRSILLDDPMLPTIISALSYASKLASSPECKKPIYWEKDIYPEGNYTDSPY